MFRRNQPNRTEIGPDMDPAERLAIVAAGMADIFELFSPVREAAVGYRAQLEADGFSPTMAEQMAANAHDIIVATLVTGVE